MDKSDDKIGGPGTHVEIDESKFGKCKYNRGRLIEGQWVLGTICHETIEMFLVTVPSHDKETLISIIKELNQEPLFCQTVGDHMIVLKRKISYI